MNTDRHPTVAAWLKFFTYEHLPERLQVASKPFGELAVKLADELPDCEHDPPACRGRSMTPVGAGGWWPDP